LISLSESGVVLKLGMLRLERKYVKLTRSLMSDSVIYCWWLRVTLTSDLIGLTDTDSTVKKGEGEETTLLT